jgi:hypothetical protein
MTLTHKKRNSRRGDLWDVQVRLTKKAGATGNRHLPIGKMAVGFISDDQLDDDGLPKCGDHLHIRVHGVVMMRTSVVERVVGLPNGFVVHTTNGGRYEATFLKRNLLRGRI